MTDNLQQITVSLSVLPRLRELGYARQVIEELKAVQSVPQSAGKEWLRNLRSVIENFFRDTGKLAHKLDGVVFYGDWDSPADVREFLRETLWLTKDETNRIRSIYGSLSDIVHGKQSMMNPIVVAYDCWSIVEVITYRIKNQVERQRVVRPENCVGVYRLAKQFIAGLRNRKYRGRAFEIEFDTGLMEMTRELLRKDDTEYLWKLMTDVTVRDGLRNRAASVMFGRRLGDDSAHENKIKEDMREYYLNNLDMNHWLVFRGVALALANRARDARCLLDYISKIKEDPALLEQNLQETYSFYKDRGGARKSYISTIANIEDCPTSKCLWEIFYVSRRADSGNKEICQLLIRRMKQTERQELKDFCEEAVKHMNCPDLHHPKTRR